MAPRRRVLITCVGSTNALSIVKALRRQDEFAVEIHGVDCVPAEETAGAAFCDGFRRVPPFREEGDYVDALRKTVEERDIDLVFACLDPEVVLLSRHRAEFPEGVLQIPPDRAVEIAVDKLATHRFPRERGFGTPDTHAVESVADAPGMVAREGLSFPLVAKPRRGFGTLGMETIRSPEELVLLARIEGPLLQAHAAGEEVTVDLFANEGRVVSAVPRVRLATKSGQIYKGRTERDETVITEVKRLAEALELHGPANVQCFRNGGELLFTDVNPRTSGGLTLTTEAGVNIPLLALKLADGQRLEPIDDFALVTMCRHWEEVFLGPS